MDKKLKELIKTKGLSDDDLITLINSSNDEDNESESSDDSEDQNEAENPTAEKESGKMSMSDFDSLIEKKVNTLLKKKKSKPKGKAITNENGIYLEGFGSIPMINKKK